MSLISKCFKFLLENYVEKEFEKIELVNPSVEIIYEEYTLEGIYNKIEKCARICYLSESGKLSSEKFVDGLIKRGHLSPTEHGTVYIKEPIKFYSNGKPFSDKNIFKIFENNQYSYVNINKDDCIAYITTNVRVLIENENDLGTDWKTFVKNNICEPCEGHENRFSFLVHDAQIAITREFNRHRANSVSESSTRYCDFSATKFNSSVKFSKPHWWDESGPESKFWAKAGMVFSNLFYKTLRSLGVKPEDARYVLLLGTSTTVAYTSSETGWKHLLDLRLAGAAHPDSRYIAKKINKLLNNG